MTASLAPPILGTERLILRPLRDDDADPMTVLADDFDVARMTTSIPHPYSRDMAVGFIGRMKAADPAREVVLAIDHPRHGFIGALGFHPTPGPCPELGYWIGKPFWGQGYTTEAVTAALGWAGERWNRRVLASGHFSDNPASGQVLVKADFLYTGVVEHRYCLARDEVTATRMMIWLGSSALQTPRNACRLTNPGGLGPITSV